MDHIKNTFQGKNQPERSLISTPLHDERDELQAQGRKLWDRLCNIPALFKDKTLDNFDSKLQPKAFKAIKNYSAGSLVLMSPSIYGVGKTHLVCALANQMLSGDVIGKSTLTGAPITKPCPVRFETEGKLLSNIRATFGGQGSDEAIYKELLMYRLLIIDDVGKVQPKDYSFLQGVFFRIIDDRYTNNKDIILTTNLSLERLEEHIGGACADRLREMCSKSGFIGMVGSSYRRS